MLSFPYGVVTPGHSECREQRIGQQRCSFTQHRCQCICMGAVSVNIPHDIGPANLPVTPEKLILVSTSRWPRSRFCVISLRISRCRTRNNCASRWLVGGFRILSMSPAATSDCRHRLTVSCAMSSNITGWDMFSVKNSPKAGGQCTLTKSCSCERTHTVLRKVGYQVSCLSSDGRWNIWLTLSFSLISPDVGFRAAMQAETR